MGRNAVGSGETVGFNGVVGRPNKSTGIDSADPVVPVIWSAAVNYSRIRLVNV